jgi:hypothetical protein
MFICRCVYLCACLTYCITHTLSLTQLANFFFWFVTVETHDQAKGDMYVAVLKAFTLTLEERNPEFMVRVVRGIGLYTYTQVHTRSH